ncbi:hypothetical protein FAZ19_22495 [Sphingobacterium alkalisoli]|uniref:RHS repeat protein n=1 Tax=Sphingobacterium alkalisoli TaxID=1874115 RepID=A0A4U0GP92_9SPHI|nr:hypothetical protein [Sphingobacterium alkalisoli]TJY60710.1 hypothetical protein FAZ19_22495 [Sphingobacterium alkalisoli]GGH31484.1 hypothetical protein GCM10011418_44320 [Sphingobacterium alkalisoli]
MNVLVVKLSLIVLIVHLSAFISFSQEIERFIPPSVEAATLGKYANWKFTKNTGALEKSISIYDVSVGDINIPITLDYVSGNGVKTDESATWVGLGWRLSVGGAVIRNVVGEDDFTPSGFKNMKVPTVEEIYNPNSGFQSFPQDALHHERDSEPDIFSYILPNKSGQFIFENQGLPLHLESSPLKIIYRDSFHDFEIIDDNGDHYIFSDVEFVSKTVNSEGSSPVGDTKHADITWYLTKIISCDKVDTIYFNYSDDSSTIIDVNYSFFQTYGPDFESSYEQLSSIDMTQHLTSYVPLYLESVEYKNTKIRFNSLQDRLDGGGKRLTSIEVLKKTNQISDYTLLRKIDFETSYFYSTIQNPPLTNSEQNKYRLKLDSIRFFKGDGDFDNSYQFEYSSVMLPPKGSFAQDDYGFYNGAITNPTLLRQKQMITYGSGIITVGNADRSVKSDFLEAGILKKITYPTKGYSLFEYAPNRLYRSSTELVQSGFSCFASGINTTHTYTFVAENYSNTRVHFSLRKIGDLTGLTDRPHVIIKNLTTNTVLFTVRAEANVDVDYETAIYFEEGHVYEMYAVIPTTNPATLAYAGANINFYQEQVVDVLNNGYGLRVEKILNYDCTDNFLDFKAFKYGVSENGIGIVISDLFQSFPFERVQKFMHGVILSTPGNTPGCRTVSKTVRLFYDSSLYPLTYYQGSPLLYQEIAEYHFAGTTSALSNGKMIKTYKVEQDASLPVVDGYLSTIFQLPVKWKNSKLISESYFKESNGTYYLNRRINSEYVDVEGINGRGLKLGYRYIRSGCYFNPLPLSDFYFFDYPIYNGIRLLSKQDEFIYDAAGVNPILTKTSEYYYNSNFQTNRIVQMQSDGKEKITEINFTVDKLQQDPSNVIVQEMFGKNMLNSIFETQSFLGGELINRTKTNYTNYTMNLYAPERVEELDISNNRWVTLIDYSSYNKRKQPQSYIINGVNTVVLWGYSDQYPVAKIENATYAEVLLALGGGSVATNKINALNSTDVSDETIKNTIDLLRNNTGMQKAQISSYTYRPLVGMTSMTDPRGITEYYEYDGFQRLKDVLDFEDNVLKNYRYHYRP